MRERPTLLGVFLITMTFCFLLVLLTSCADNKIDPDQIQNTLVEVVNIDGCHVYRFYDKSEYRYFASCEGVVSGGFARKEEEELLHEIGDLKKIEAGLKSDLKYVLDQNKILANQIYDLNETIRNLGERLKALTGRSE